MKLSVDILSYLKNLFYTKDEVDDELSSKSNTNHTHNTVTSSTNGLMSSSDKNKLDGIANNANNYSLPTASSSTLGGVKVGTNLSINNGILSSTNTTYGTATTSSNGLMSASDKTKLNGIATGATANTVDSSLSSTSTNPVQNKIINSALSGKAASSHTHNTATTSANGLMSSSDKSKLDGVATNANNYSLPTASSSTLGGIKVGSNLSISNGVLSATDTTYGTATSSSNGLMSSSDKSKLDGVASNANNYSLPTASSSTLGGVKVGTNLSISNGVLSATNTTYSAATTSAQGLMTAADKVKLNGIATGATANTIDSSLSSTSTNAVQNKVINTALAGKANSSHTHDYNSTPSISCYLSGNPTPDGTTITSKSITRLGVYDRIQIPYKNGTQEGYKTEVFQMESFILRCFWRLNGLGSNSAIMFNLWNPNSSGSENINITVTPSQNRTWVKINNGNNTVTEYDSYGAGYGNNTTTNNFIFLKVTGNDLFYSIDKNNATISTGSESRAATSDPNYWCFGVKAGAWSTGTAMDFVISPIQIIPLK